jgi:hypothetical protein
VRIMIDAKPSLTCTLTHSCAHLLALVGLSWPSLQVINSLIQPDMKFTKTSAKVRHPPPYRSGPLDTHTHTHARARAHTHIHTHTHKHTHTQAHTHTHTHVPSSYEQPSFTHTGCATFCGATYSHTSLFVAGAHVPQFGQWTDAYAGTVYGIGVASEDVLAKFQAGFESGVLARPTPSPKQRAGSVTSGGGPSPASAGGADSGGGSAASSDVLVSAHERRRERVGVCMGVRARVRLRLCFESLGSRGLLECLMCLCSSVHPADPSVGGIKASTIPCPSRI